MGFVYVLKNPSMPSLYKVGMTTKNKVDARVAKLYTTGVPQPFQVVHLVKTRKPMELEDAIHKRLERYRVRKNREFFHCSLWRIKRAISAEQGKHPMKWPLRLAVVSLAYYLSTFEAVVEFVDVLFHHIVESYVQLVAYCGNAPKAISDLMDQISL